MTNDVPTTKEEVEELVSQVPPAHEVQEALQLVKESGYSREPDEPHRIKFLKWLSVAMFLIVVLISLITTLDSRNSFRDQVRDLGVANQCRNSVSGELLIAKAEGIVAGNTYNAVLGDALIGAIQQTNTPERLAEINRQLSDARSDLQRTAELIQTKIERQREVPELCK